MKKLSWIELQMFKLRVRWSAYQVKSAARWMAEHATVRQLRQLADALRDKAQTLQYAKDEVATFANQVDQNVEKIVLRRVFKRWL